MKDMFEKQSELAQDVITISQAKSVHENEIWSSKLGDYYASVAAFNKYVEEQNEKNK